MKLLAISDNYIPAEFMQIGFAPLSELGVTVEVRSWEQPTLVDLQQANLAIEKHGPDAVSLPAELMEGVEDVEIVSVQFTPISRRFIERMPRLKVIGVLRGGVENIAVDCATERSVAVLNTPGRNARAVAECTLGLILAEIRNLARAHAELKRGRWTRDFPNHGQVPELCGKTVGLVGYGAVARLVAGYLLAMGSRVIAYDPFVREDTSPVSLVDLETLLRESDVVSLHARYSKETHHLIGDRQLRMMKPTAVLVNTARSGLVDEAALTAVLREGAIMGAALDVFDVEPLPPDHPLLELPNVTLAPHVAGTTIDAFRNSPRLMAEHLRRLLCGAGDLPIVNGVAPRFDSPRGGRKEK